MASGVFRVLTAGVALAAAVALAPPAAADDNQPPAKPTGLQVNLQACGARPVMVGPNSSDQLIVLPTDPDNNAVTVDFAWWPADHPDQVSTGVTATLPSGLFQQWNIAQSQLADATTYTWHARADDGHAVGPWSDDCQFTTDFTRPPVPTVSSVDYPAGVTSGGSGIPGAFTFSGNGNPDVVAFRYNFDDKTVDVPADQPGGTATVQLTPSHVGANGVWVSSVDPAGTSSATRTEYDFPVAFNAPTVSCTPKVDYVGQPRTCVVTPQDQTSVGFTYQVNSGSAVDLKAGPDGTATFTVTPTDPLRSTRVQVRSRLANGNLTDATTAALSVRMGVPTVDQSVQATTFGATVQFTFHSGLPGSTTFTYTWGAGDPVSVPVGSDGVTTVSLVVDQTWFEELDVYSSTAAGIQSAPVQTGVSVDQ